MKPMKGIRYTSEHVRREAEAYRAWARERDREQYQESILARIYAVCEVRQHKLEVRFYGAQAY